MKKKEVTVYEKSLKKAVNELRNYFEMDKYSKEIEYEDWTVLQLKSIRITKSDLECPGTYLQFTFDVEY